MAQPVHKPKFPVIDADPSLGKVISSFRPRDWQHLVLATVVSLPFGYAVGRPILMRPSMYTSGLIGATFGMFLGFQNSFTRLTGYQDNKVEVEKHLRKTQPADIPS